MFFVLFFFFNDTATTEIYTLSLHDALPIWRRDHEDRSLAGRLDEALVGACRGIALHGMAHGVRPSGIMQKDRKSTRLNSSHANISYAVFCLKKKKKQIYRNLSQ